jgi:hypothetical protein
MPDIIIIIIIIIIIKCIAYVVSKIGVREHDTVAGRAAMTSRRNVMPLFSGSSGPKKILEQ